ncbi:hypothetical protein J1605_005156 [Eschrichtius robustus]|uniref:Uncharacterized protein n=1 Tax=Eschrichtius robustus TaxID=9764 RepID=A0AB34HD30_ESCRO|nr:hypothetical protein J1605_005156 [Eschrichtius robustus]
MRKLSQKSGGGTGEPRDDGVMRLSSTDKRSGKIHAGREGAEIEPWEDADYLVYKVTDRFGFLHEEELPYHNAAMERVSPALRLFTVTGELTFIRGVKPATFVIVSAVLYVSAAVIVRI